MPNLKPQLKQLHLSASANALKSSQRSPDMYESYIYVHKSCNRATPNQIITYKHAILLHKLYNVNFPQADWLDLNIHQIITSRQTKFKITKANKFLIGNNILTTRLSILNNKIEPNDLNLPLDSFKVKYKKMLFCYN